MHKDLCEKLSSAAVIGTGLMLVVKNTLTSFAETKLKSASALQDTVFLFSDWTCQPLRVTCHRDFALKIFSDSEKQYSVQNEHTCKAKK